MEEKIFHVKMKSNRFPDELLRQLSEHERIQAGRKTEISDRKRRPRGSEHLFNADYNFRGSNYSTLGRSLLESIRTRVFGFKPVQANGNAIAEIWMN